jgi:hypothetical protein
VLRKHTDFKSRIQPDATASAAFHERCKAEVQAINIFFPNLHNDKIRIAFAAWLAFACAMDDTLETLPPDTGEAALVESIEIAQHGTQRSDVLSSHAIDANDDLDSVGK